MDEWIIQSQSRSVLDRLSLLRSYHISKILFQKSFCLQRGHKRVSCTRQDGWLYSDWATVSLSARRRQRIDAQPSPAGPPAIGHRRTDLELLDLICVLCNPLLSLHGRRVCRLNCQRGWKGKKGVRALPLREQSRKESCASMFPFSGAFAP